MAILHLLERADHQWKAAGGRAFGGDQDSAEDKAHREGTAWAGDDPNRRYEVTLKRS